MASWGRAEFEDLKKLRDRLQNLQRIEIQEFCVMVSKELAARLLARVIKRTPVGDYPTESGKKGGTLRRGWTGGKRQAAKKYADSLPVHKIGSDYVITIENPVEYGVYVEYGHPQTPGRYVPAIGKRLKKAWVPGQFMLTKSEREVEATMQALIEKRLLEFLKEVF